MKEIFHTLGAMDSIDIHTQAELLAKRIATIVTTTSPVQENLSARRVEVVLNAIASTTGVPVNEWDVDLWKGGCKVALQIILEIMEEEGDRRQVIASLTAEGKQRRANDRNRIKTRPDQLDKVAFQKAFMVNRDSYKTTAEGIRDLRIKPQFQDYPDKTLKGWLKGFEIEKPKKTETKDQDNIKL